jgi:hypothetical protein
MLNDYVRNNWQNGPGVGHPPIDATNLNNIESKLEELDQYLYNVKQNYRFSDIKKYFWERNCKEINMFDDVDNWTAGAGTTIAEISGPCTGNDDVYFKDSDGVGSTIEMHSTIDAIDLTKFNDGEASSTDDIIAYSVYLFNYTFFNNMTLKIGADAANYYTYSWAITEGWQVTFQAKKSDFAIGAGAPNWNNITYIRVETVTNNGATAAVISNLALMMYRNDPVNDGVANAFQYYNGSSWSNFFEQNTPLWNLLFDPAMNDLGIQLLNDYNDNEIYNGLKIKSDVSEFYFKSIMYSRYDDYTNNMTWYVDSNNWATAWVDDDDFTLIVCEAGGETPYTYTLNNSLEQGELLEIKLEKNIDTIKATLEKGNEQIAILEHETTIDTDEKGDLYFGYDDAGLCFIPDFIVSNINNMNLNTWDKPKVILKKEDQTKVSDTSLDNDNELYVYLPPNSMFEVLLSLDYYTNASNTPDIKIIWDISNVIMVTNRKCRGLDSSAVGISGDIKTYTRSDSSTIAYGGGDTASVDMHVTETAIVKTKNAGGKITIQWAQFNSSANPTTVKAGSYIKVTKLDSLQQND